MAGNVAWGDGKERRGRFKRTGKRSKDERKYVFADIKVWGVRDIHGERKNE